MEFDIFFSVCQTEVHGYLPDEATMFRNFFEQVELADRLGIGTAWVAESHLSTEVQKMNPGAVIPHFPVHWLPGLAWPWYVPLGTAVTVAVGMGSSLVTNGDGKTAGRNGDER